MAIRNIAGVVLLTALLSACALPQSQVRSGTQSPTLSIIGAPDGSILRVDGVSMGIADQYDGSSQTLAVEEGLHLVEILSQGTTIYQAKIYTAGGETSRVQVGANAQ